MYTNLPQSKLIEGVRQAVTEAFQYNATTHELPIAAVRWSMKYDYTGKADAWWTADGTYSMENLISLIKHIITNTYPITSPPSNNNVECPWEGEPHRN